MNLIWGVSRFKTFVALLLTLSLLVMPSSAGASSKNNLSIYIDGELISSTANRLGKQVYVPMDIITSLSGSFMLSANTNIYTISYGLKQLKFKLNDKSVLLNDQKKESKHSAMVSQKNVYLPMAWLRDLLGIKLIEDRITKSLFIYRPTTPIVDEGTATSLSAKSTVTLAESAALLQEITVSNDELKILTSTDVSTAKVFRLQFPERIVIDLPGVSIDRSTQSATNGMVQVDSDHPWVNKIRFSQFITSPASVRVVLETKSIVLFSKQIIADGKGVAIRFTEQKPITVMIDAGHGGKDPGAISPKGHFEKDFTLILANKVNDLLQREPMIIPILSRTDDTASTPLQRATLANESKVDLLISLHANTFKQSSVRGTETFYWTDDSKSLAMILHKHVLAAFGSIDRKVRKERFVILRETTMPAALLEVGYMTNAMDESKLLDEQVQNQVAEAIVIAIKEYVDSQ